VIQPGDQLVAHSYGAVVGLLAAPRLPLASLTVIEPPAFGVAARHPAVREFVAAIERAPREPRAYLDYFLPLVGSSMRLPDVLPPQLEASARATIAERGPNEAVIPLDEIAATAYPKLVVSGAHSAAFDAVADVLQQRLDAQRPVLPGAGHSIPRLGEPLNELISTFVRQAPGTVPEGDSSQFQDADNVSDNDHV
jgi:pimeloyl-ACP methyl ester carboxylesterase